MAEVGRAGQDVIGDDAIYDEGPCAACSGTATCTTCNGRGSVDDLTDCEPCDGKGDCPWCTE